jgi:GNAT superfamily N-acetyltransferase
MFAVHPVLQGQGVGNVILQAAETFASRHLQSNVEASDKKPARLTMSILSHRPELLSYYQRRGYELNGNQMPFPNDGNNGEPKRQDLELLELEKIVN